MNRPLKLVLIPTFAALALIVSTGPAAAQSLMSGGGLGLLSDPLDARARSLGSVGTGLSGWHLLATDPAAAAGLTLPSIHATLQPTNLQVEGGFEAGGTRFPVAGVSYPFGRHVISLQFGSFLDQEWQVQVQREIAVPGSPTEGVTMVTTRDRYESVGGVGQVRVGWATRIGSNVAVGLSAGSYSGAIERRFLRELNPDQVGPDVEAFRATGRWRASGALASAGVIWDISSLYRVAASVDWADDLRLDPIAPTTGGVREYALPLTARVGGEFVLSPGIALAAGFSRADWSDTDGALGGDAARGTAWGYGAGIELRGPTWRGQGVPLRIGMRHQDLPFHFAGAPAEEGSFSAGIGTNLAIMETMPVARVDLGVERGSREAGTLSETFWRTTVSLRLAGG